MFHNRVHSISKRNSDSHLSFYQSSLSTSKPPTTKPSWSIFLGSYQSAPSRRAGHLPTQVCATSYEHIWRLYLFTDFYFFSKVEFPQISFFRILIHELVLDLFHFVSCKYYGNVPCMVQLCKVKQFLYYSAFTSLCVQMHESEGK